MRARRRASRSRTRSGPLSQRQPRLPFRVEFPFVGCVGADPVAGGAAPVNDRERKVRDGGRKIEEGADRGDEIEPLLQRDSLV